MAWHKLRQALDGVESTATEVRRKSMISPNPHLNPKVRSAGFFSSDVGRLLSGWESTSYSIDYYLQSELRELRARSRRMVRANPYGKKFIATIKANIIGPKGINVQAQSIYRRQLDMAANDAIEKAFLEWGTYHCDYLGRSTWVDLQNMAISCAAQDGEFIFRKHYDGPHGFRLQAIDPELLDTMKNTAVRRGEIRLGVEYDRTGRVVAYWFLDKPRNAQNQYTAANSTRVPAHQIIHGFISEWPDQSRGAPWMHASLERSKHLEKYDEAAIVKARSTASTMAVIKSGDEDSYTGAEDGAGAYDDATLDEYAAGTIKDIGNRDIVNLDSDYPHQMYSAFVKAQLQGIASGLGISYHSLSNDLEGVNYSSIRAGVMEDREVFKGLQNWFIRSLVRPVYEEWLIQAHARNLIQIGSTPLGRPVGEYLPAHYQPRRWAWVDPLKDGQANQMALDNRTKSHSQIMREAGDDPETVWREIERDQAMMTALGIAPVPPTPIPTAEVMNDET